MSTYLVALVLCDFVSVAGTTNKGLPVQVFAQSAQISQATFALSTAISGVEYFERIFGINFTLPKLDMIAIPDFSAGGEFDGESDFTLLFPLLLAMENWGLITYRESALLYDSSSSPTSFRQSVALVVIHELLAEIF